MKQEYMTMRLSVENRANIIRRKSDGQSFGKGLIIRLHDGDVPENYEEVAYEENVVIETISEDYKEDTNI